MLPCDRECAECCVVVRWCVRWRLYVTWGVRARAHGNCAAGSDPFYAVAQESWEEQRGFLTSALHALDEPFTQEMRVAAHQPPGTNSATTTLPQSPLASAIREEVAAITAPAPDPIAHGYTQVRNT